MDNQHRAVVIDAAVCVAALPPVVPENTCQPFEPLWNGVRAWAKFKPRDFRDHGIHPSSLGKWCRRERGFSVLQFLSKEKIPLHRVEPTTQLYFEAGHAVHEYWQNSIFGEMRILEGRWRCSHCGEMHGHAGQLILKPHKCSKCGAGSHALRFQEPSLIIPAHEVLGVPEESLSDEEKELYRVVGHTDGIFNLKGFGRMVAELKSEKSGKWELRTTAEPDHIIQGLVYAYAAKLDSVLIVYVQKDTYAIKSFLVKGVAKTISWLYGEVRTIYTAHKKGTISKLEGVCTDKNCFRAKLCPFKSVCFD